MLKENSVIYFYSDIPPPPLLLQESGLDDPSVCPVEPSSSSTVKYHLVEEATKHGKRKLLDSNRYSSNVKQRHSGTTVLYGRKATHARPQSLNGMALKLANITTTMFQMWELQPPQDIEDHQKQGNAWPLQTSIRHHWRGIYDIIIHNYRQRC